MGKPLVLAAIALAVILMILAGAYYLTPAGSLPAFIPGYEHGVAGHRTAHALGALIGAAVLLVFALVRGRSANH